MALSQGKPRRQGSGRGRMSVGLKAAAVVFQGALIALVSGYAAPAAAGAGGNDLAKMANVSLYRLIGVAETAGTGTTDGAILVDAQSGDWFCKNSAGVDQIGVGSIGHYCFIVDDDTVARTSAGRTRPRAGVVVAVDATGVLVRIAPEIAAAAERYIHLPYVIDATSLSTPINIELVSPVAGSITRLFTTVQTAIVTGGDVTVLVGATTVAGLVCTIPDGAAKGSIVTGTPTAGDASASVAPGSRIQIASGVPFNGGGAVNGVLEIAY